MTWDPHDPLDGWLDTRPGDDASPCLDDNLLAGLCEGRLPEAERGPALAHLAACPACRGLAGELAAELPAAPRAGAPQRRRAVWAAAAALIVGLGAAAWFAPRDAAEGPATLEAAVARIAPGLVPLGDAELAAPCGEALRGAFGVRAPGEVTLEVRPRCAWEPVPGASGYVVRLVGEDGLLWERTVEATATDYPPDAPALAEGARYVLEVTAQGVPVEPAAGTFAVAAAAERAAWDAARQRARAQVAEPLRWLALAHVALRRGYLEEAAAAAQRYAEAAPRDARGAAVLRRLEAR